MRTKRAFKGVRAYTLLKKFVTTNTMRTLKINVHINILIKHYLRSYKSYTLHSRILEVFYMSLNSIYFGYVTEIKLFKFIEDVITEFIKMYN